MDEASTLSELMAHFRMRLSLAGIEDPAAEARILVGGLMGLERSDFIARGDMKVGAIDEARLHAAIGRRLDGEPPYRILGSRGFHGLELKLSRETLEPRPDTEVLVDAVLDELEGRRNAPLRILDLGTGTGAICLALLAELPASTGIGVDISDDALATASENAVRNGLGARFETRRSNWFDAVSGMFDIVVSNPPYIETAVIATLDREVRDHDPVAALDGGPDGLMAYRAIAAGVLPFLAASGFVAVETGHDQRVSVERVFEDRGFLLAKACRDYGGNDRVQIFRHRP